MRALEFITGHVIFKVRCNQIYQLKTTMVIDGAAKINPENLLMLKVSKSRNVFFWPRILPKNKRKHVAY